MWGRVHDLHGTGGSTADTCKVALSNNTAPTTAIGAVLADITQISQLALVIRLVVRLHQRRSAFRRYWKRCPARYRLDCYCLPGALRYAVFL